MKTTKHVALALTSIFALAGPAEAQTGPQYADDSVIVADGDVRPLISVRIDANAGDEFYVAARMATKSARQNRTHRMLVALLLSCTDGVDEVRTTQNINYGQQALVHWGRYIFQAPHDGAFDCTLRTRGLVHGQQSNPPARFTVDGANTYITVSGKQPSWVRNKYQTSQRLIKTRTAKDVAVMWFTAPSSVSTFSVTGDVELTNCYDTGYLCDTVPRNTRSTVVGTRLLVMQKNRSGGYCRITGWPEAGLKRTSITWEQHHKKAYHRVGGIPVSTSSSCTRDFRIKVYTKVLSGNDVLIERQPYTNIFVRQ